MKLDGKEMAVGLEGLEGLILETILFKLEPQVVTNVACVSTKLRAAASDDALWRHFCASDLGLDAPFDPDGNPCPSFKVSSSSSLLYEVIFDGFLYRLLDCVVDRDDGGRHGRVSGGS